MRLKNRNWKRSGWFCLGLALITFVAFLPALSHAFLTYDDQQYVTENPHVQAGLSWQGVVWAFRSFYGSNWHPLTWLSHMLDCQWYGLNPLGHHLTNVLLHVTNTVLVFLLWHRLTGAVWRSAWVAALFGWHPLHVESVAWVAERKDVLSALFFLLTLLAYVRYAQRRENTGKRFHSAFFFLLAVGLFALGLMSKPMVVTLPFVLLLLDYWPLARLGEAPVQFSWGCLGKRLCEKVPFLVLAGLASWLTVNAQQQGYSVVSKAALPISQRLAHVPLAYGHYLQTMILPRHLAVYYPYERTIHVAGLVGVTAVLGLITALAIGFARRIPYLIVGWLWYLGMLVPVIGLVQVGDQAWADRYTYLPLIGLFVVLVWGGADLAARAVLWMRRRREAQPVAERVMPQSSGAQTSETPGSLRIGSNLVAGAICLALLAATAVQLRYWKNTRALFEHAARVTHHNGRALAMLGSFLAEEGKLDQAQELYRQALEYNPNDPEAQFFLARSYEQQGKLEEAVNAYNQALWFRPLQEKTHIALGMMLAKQGKLEEAAAQYQAALTINPESAIAENNLARVYHTQGDLDAAIAHYFAALKRDPKLAAAHNNLGVLLLQKGRVAEGADQLHQAVRLNPRDLEARLNLALALNQQERWAEAVDIFSALNVRYSQDARFHSQFAVALSHVNRTRDALSHYAQALLLKPELPEALDGLAWLLATDPRAELRNGPEAVRMAEEACQLTGRKQPRMLATLAAADAEVGRYPEAMSTASAAQESAQSAGQKALAEKCRAMIEQFQQQKPWRETSSGDKPD